MPSARNLQKESQVVQDQIRKTLQKQDYGKTVKARLEQKHAQRRQKILIVANRLPTTAKSTAEGEWIFENAAGGLVSCLAGVHGAFEMVWIGWPGNDVPETDQARVAEAAMKQNCYPVFLSGELIDLYYNGFANNILWPILHYIMPPFDKGVQECATGQFEAYKQANEKFVEAILQVYEDDDYVWVHDYHLMLVPKLLREAKPDSNIGWFLHTPFPSAEVYRTLAWRQELIESLLHANLLGFHVYDYLRHFLSSCVQLTSLDLEITGHTVDATPIGGCIVTCATVPVGIAPEEFTDSLADQYVKEQIDKLRQQYDGRKVILGIDRLDYMKGVPHKLMAFQAFLDKHPEWVGECVLVQLAVPSRRDIPEYQRLQRQVHELVGQICGRHSKLERGTPVIYLDQTMSHDDLVALYHVADVALITSLRDGMNLVSYEYVACQYSKHPPGVLVLSEFAGAAQSLGAGAIRINPWNVQETADAIHDALRMPHDEREALHEYAFKYITGHTSRKWAETFLQCLQEASSDVMEVTMEVPALLKFEDLLTDWSESSRRLVILDFMECLVPPKRRSMSRNRKRGPWATVVPPDLVECLRTIVESENTTVIVTSDKSRGDIPEALRSLPLIVAPEGGCVCNCGPDSEWRQVADEVNESWWRLVDESNEGGVKAIFKYFSERTPGSYIEEQAFFIRWYWEDTQTDFGSAQAREVLIHLWAGPLVNSQAEVVIGDRCITVRPHACSRSVCLEKLLLEEVGENSMEEVDFALCFQVVAHRDEDVFEMLMNMLGSPVVDEDQLQAAVKPASEGCSPTARRGGAVTPDREEGGEPHLRTPPGPAPEPAPGEPPPDYDWVPTAMRERGEREAVFLEETGSAPAPLELPVNALEDQSYCSCYTLSLGMRKTKAQNMLPHPYHVQNLIRAMAARLPQRTDKVEPESAQTAS